MSELDPVESHLSAPDLDPKLAEAFAAINLPAWFDPTMFANFELFNSVLPPAFVDVLEKLDFGSRPALDAQILSTMASVQPFLEHGALAQATSDIMDGVTPPQSSVAHVNSILVAAQPAIEAQRVADDLERRSLALEALVDVPDSQLEVAAAALDRVEGLKPISTRGIAPEPSARSHDELSQAVIDRYTDVIAQPLRRAVDLLSQSVSLAVETDRKSRRFARWSIAVAVGGIVVGAAVGLLPRFF